MRGTLLSWILMTGLGLSSCRSDPPLDPMQPRPVAEVDRWLVVADGESVGSIVLIEIEDPAGTVRFYRAESAAGQWLGFVDMSGRFFKRVPFRETEEYIGMYPMEKGLGLLFELDGPVSLRVPGGAGGAREASTEVDR